MLRRAERRAGVGSRAGTLAVLARRARSRVDVEGGSTEVVEGGRWREGGREARAMSGDGAFGAIDGRRDLLVAAAADLLVSVGEGMAGVEAREEWPAAASGMEVVVVVVVVMTGAGVATFRFLGVGFVGDVEIPGSAWLSSCLGVVSLFRFLAGDLATSFPLSLAALTTTLSPTSSVLGLNKLLITLPTTPSLVAACSASIAACAACSLARFSFFSFLASLSFMPRLLSCNSSIPKESALISPGARIFPGAVVAILSSSTNSSLVTSARAFAAR